MEKRTLWGENSPVCCADSPLWDGASGETGNFPVMPRAPSPRELTLRSKG